MVSEPPKRWIGTGFLAGSGIYLNQLRTGILGVYLHKSLREEREEREEPETWEAFVCNAIRKHLETDSWTGLQEDSEVRDVLFIVIGLQLLHFGPFEAWNAQLEMEISKSHGTNSHSLVEYAPGTLQLCTTIIIMRLGFTLFEAPTGSSWLIPKT